MNIDDVPRIIYFNTDGSDFDDDENENYNDYLKDNYTNYDNIDSTNNNKSNNNYNYYDNVSEEDKSYEGILTTEKKKLIEDFVHKYKDSNNTTSDGDRISEDDFCLMIDKLKLDKDLAKDLYKEIDKISSGSGIRIDDFISNFSYKTSSSSLSTLNSLKLSFKEGIKEINKDKGNLSSNSENIILRLKGLRNKSYFQNDVEAMQEFDW